MQCHWEMWKVHAWWRIFLSFELHQYIRISVGSFSPEVVILYSPRGFRNASFDENNDYYRIKKMDTFSPSWFDVETSLGHHPWSRLCGNLGNTMPKFHTWRLQVMWKLEMSGYSYIFTFKNILLIFLKIKVLRSF